MGEKDRIKRVGGGKVGKVIVCETKVAKNPFCFQETGQKFYSYEELCYYICQYPALFQVDFVTDELIEWLQKEIKAYTLAEKLAYLKRNNVQSRAQVLTILEAYPYLSPKDIRAVIERLDLLHLKEPWLQKRYYADALYKAGKPQQALKIYDHLVYEIPEREENYQWLAAVWHAKGSCLAKDMQYEEAAKSFKKACEYGNYEKSRKSYWITLYLLGKQEEIKEDIAQNNIPIEKYSDFIEEMKRKEETLVDYKDYQRLERACTLKEEGNQKEYQKMMKNLSAKWKQEYRENTRIR